ncbi:phage holin [Domibacillus sp. PGB-M46]|uniref:phage holin n=1 Tax=Domibacillus sp. PGB-M46 TaxID=2910255 RepID=UPI001F577585|nr:phage holin [Domibacillus sp. PGB-M46]MCI2256523.1 phage holin [Domibacillus sp. PGB-M46]
MKNIDHGTIVRTVVLFVALINQMLLAAGYSPLPFKNEEVELFVTTLITAVTAVWAWWKNNDISREARRKAALLKREEQSK